jgi:hypothetical protein
MKSIELRYVNRKKKNLHMTYLKKYFLAVSTVALLTSSLLTTYLAPLSDLLKGLLLGIQIATFIWLFVIIWVLPEP